MSKTPSGKPKAPSIKDVAALAGVSVPTVSRYLNTPDRVREEKRMAVAEAIRKLDYHPNSIARALVSEQSKQCLVLSSDIALYGQYQTIRGIENAASRHGYSVAISLIDGSSQRHIENSVREGLNHNPGAIILLDFDKTSAVQSLIPKRIPLVVVAGDPDTPAAQLALGEYEGAQTVTRHLLERLDLAGHPDATVHFVGIHAGSGLDRRENGWADALMQAGRRVPEPVRLGWDVLEAEQEGLRLASLKQPIRAVFAANDEAAMGVIRGLEQGGVFVPHNVLVAGFDDHPLSKIWNPPITTIRQDFFAAGVQAFSMLLPMIDDVANGKEHGDHWHARHEMIGDLIIRSSSASVPVR